MMSKNSSDVLASNHGQSVEVEYLVCEMSQESACQIRRIIHKAGKYFAESELEAKKTYFENTIKPTVIQNGNRIAVPIIYGSPERWKSVQSDGALRDKDGKLIDLTVDQYLSIGREPPHKEGQKASMLGFEYRTRTLELLGRVTKELSSNGTPRL